VSTISVISFVIFIVAAPMTGWYAGKLFVEWLNGKDIDL